MAAVWLVGATVVDGSGADPVEDLAVVIEDGRIVGLGGTPPSGADVVDCSGLTLTPGLIDAHVHLGLSSEIDDSMRHGLSVAEIAADMFDNCAADPRRRVHHGARHRRHRRRARRRRRVGQGARAADPAVRPGPVPDRRPRLPRRRVGADRALGPPRDPGTARLSMLSDGPDEMRKNVREAFRRGADFLKLCVTGGVVVAPRQAHRHPVRGRGDRRRRAGGDGPRHLRHGARPQQRRHPQRGAGRREVRRARLGDRRGDGGADGASTASRTCRRWPSSRPCSTTPATAGLSTRHRATRGRRVLQGQIDAVRTSRAAGVRVGLGLRPHRARTRTAAGASCCSGPSIETPMDALVAATSQRRHPRHRRRRRHDRGRQAGRPRGVLAATRFDDPKLFADRATGRARRAETARW